MTNAQALTLFRQQVWQYYQDYGRSMPWRDPGPDGSYDPYAIMVSEIMLQQTQVSRVLPKYKEWLTLFPDVATLAAAQQVTVLQAWSGLGYNRRARFLHQAAQAIVAQYDGVMPRTMAELVRLPGIGHNTAGAIMAYAYGKPVAYIETNIRTVFIHHFFRDSTAVEDKDILPLVQASLPTSVPSHQNRVWYWALMDYGAYLKQQNGNNISQSAHYKKQSTFKGSIRQTRGAILRSLFDRQLSRSELSQAIESHHFDKALDSLLKDSLVQQNGDHYHL